MKTLELRLHEILPYNEEDACILVLSQYLDLTNLNYNNKSFVFVIEMSTEMAVNKFYDRVLQVTFENDHAVINIRDSGEKFTAFLLMMTDTGKDINLKF